jgi:hypothetical protein
MEFLQNFVADFAFDKNWDYRRGIVFMWDAHADPYLAWWGVGGVRINPKYPIYCPVEPDQTGVSIQ